MPRHGIAPATIVAAVAVSTWLITGVAILDIVKFLAYEAVFVALPGIALLMALRGRRSGSLVTVALGWPLGQTLEILAFSGTAALGVRGLFLVYPVAIVALSAVLILRRRATSAQSPWESATASRTALWAAAAVLSIGLLYLAFMFLPVVPLPTATSSEAYAPDFVYFLGLTAQMLHHWPPTSPGLSGTPLYYEWFVFFHMAAVAQVTHLAIPTIALRLDYVPTILVIGCQLLATGRYLGRSLWAGVTALVVILMLGPLDLTTDVASGNPFFEGFFFHLWASWTFAFGLMFFLALIYLVSERMHSPSWRRSADLGAWILIGLLMIGASGAKATVLPVLITGTALYAVVVFALTRRLSPAVLVTLVLGAALFAVTFKVVYGGGVPGTVIELFAPLARTAPVIFVNEISNPTLRAIMIPFADVCGIAGMMLGLVGMLYLLRRRHRSELSRFAWPICLFVAGLVITNVSHQVAYSELYFQDTGYIAGGLAAAQGIRLAWLDAGQSLPMSRRGVLVSFAASLVVLLMLVTITSLTVAHPLALEIRYAGLAAACVAFIVVSMLLLWARHRSTAGVLALGLIPLLASTALTFPLTLAPTAKKLLTGVALTQAQPDPQTVWALTPGLLTALEWLQGHSPIGAVVAVSNHWVNPQKTDAREYYYSAFSEREIFVEAYDPARFGITPGVTIAADRNFAYRQRLNDAVFNQADAAALAILTRQYGVRYLFIDRIHGTVDPDVLHLGRVVFTNQDAIIVEVA